MEIGQYISDLLNKHNEVSLPGFGTFFKQSTSAYFNEAEGIFYPPSEKIDFRSEENSSSLLVNHIIKNKHISESSALYFIERFCENLNKNLNKDLSTVISPLGTLLKTDSGYVLESPSINGPSFFGLKPIKVPDTSNNNIKANGPELEGTLVNSVEKTVSSSKGVWITFAILFLIATIGGLAYFFYPQYFKNIKFSANNTPKNKITAPVVRRDSIKDSVSFADSIVRQLESQGMQGAQVEKARDTFKISSTVTSPDTLKAAPQAEKVYEIIVASFGLKREAETSLRNLRHRGIDAKIVFDVRRPKFKISIGTFPSMEAASKEKKRIQQDLFRDAWILTVINKKN
ncbi:SPOR domain-containing protein [Pedobacter sp. P351]|uniref:HU domain-containing protein n=1 Tax=Pedobacter superstes TaxID=3133441 RepID=UPI00309727DB